MTKPSRQPIDTSRPHLTLQTQMVDNPGYLPGHPDSIKQSKVQFNIGESAIETLYARSNIDRAQKRAADEFRRLFEVMGGKGAGAIDYGREHVDGGKSRDPISIKQLEAGQELAAIRRAIVKKYGEHAYWLVTHICGQGHSIHELTSTRRQRDTMTDNLRMYLDLMAEEWGFRKRETKGKAQ